jgi:predicted GIY-YIG superfamily endonuclease
MTNHAERKHRADVKAEPSCWFSYVLRLSDGTFYVGSTNSPGARWTEHAVDIGAKATVGRPFRICMVLPFLSRKEAEYNEERLQKALDQSPERLEALLSVFDQMINVVRPQKTLSQLQEEEIAYEREMRSVFHHSKALSYNPGGRPNTACGYGGREYYSTTDWDQLRKMARDEDFTGNAYGRRVCRRCLELAPTEVASVNEQ